MGRGPTFLIFRSHAFILFGVDLPASLLARADEMIE
jgi:hypothetical protein